MKNNQIENVIIRLLHSFILEKVNQYKEPKRKGTPKGDMIGLCKNKYHAALLCMIPKFKIIDIAQSLNINYQTFRVWRSQSIFQECIKKHTEEFCNRLNYGKQAQL